MNPSEYLFNEDFMILNDDYKLKVINKLDKRFIDKEELKDKINQKIKYREINRLKLIRAEYFIKAYKEILEILK
jgi:hypothetical protein